MTAPKPEPAECGECGCIHRPGENSMCPGWRPGPYDGPRDDEPEEDAESLIERLDEALCSLLHTGGEIGEHSPRTHLDLFYAKQAESPVAAPCDTGELIDYLEAAARDLPLEQFLIAMRCKLKGGGSGCKEYAKSQNQLATVIEQRDTALARVKELEIDLGIANQHFRARVAELEATESALASARSRIRELEADWDAERVDRLNAESALASARDLLERWRGLGVTGFVDKDTDAWLTSHPAPVAVLPPISESDSG